MKKLSCGFLITLLVLTGASQSMVGMQREIEAPRLMKFENGSSALFHKFVDGTSRADIYGDDGKVVRSSYFDARGNQFQPTAQVSTSSGVEDTLKGASVAGGIGIGLWACSYLPSEVKGFVFKCLAAGAVPAIAYGVARNLPSLLDSWNSQNLTTDPLSIAQRAAAQSQQAAEVLIEHDRAIAETQKQTRQAMSLLTGKEDNKKKSKKAKDAYESDSDSDSDSEDEVQPNYYADLESGYCTCVINGQNVLYRYNRVYRYRVFYNANNTPAGYYYETQRAYSPLRPHEYFASLNRKDSKAARRAHNQVVNTPAVQERQQAGYNQQPAGRGRGRVQQPVHQQVAFNFPQQQ